MISTLLPFLLKLAAWVFFIYGILNLIPGVKEQGFMEQLKKVFSPVFNQVQKHLPAPYHALTPFATSIGLYLLAFVVRIVGSAVKTII